MKETLAAAQENAANAADRMVALLKRIVATPQDFSDDALCKIAGSPCIAQSMVSIKENSQPDYDCLFALLGDAAGFDLIRNLVTMEILRRQEMAAAPDA